jgi:hypothetical protein
MEVLMKNTCAFVRLCAVAAIGPLLTGCLSIGLVVSARLEAQSRRITAVTGATLVGDQVFLRVDAELASGKRETLTIEIPFGELERDGKSADWSPTTGPGEINLHVPESALRRGRSLPNKGTPVPIETLALQRLEDLAYVSERLEPGVHVVSIQSPPYLAGLQRRTIPVVLDTRDGRQPMTVSLADLPASVKHRRPLLLLMPFAAAVDAVTLPLQIVGIILFMPEC